MEKCPRVRVLLHIPRGPCCSFHSEVFTLACSPRKRPRWLHGLTSVFGGTASTVLPPCYHIA